MSSPFFNKQDQEEYEALLRALQWLEGFGVFFVECTPSQGIDLIEYLRNDLRIYKETVNSGYNKTINTLILKQEIKDLKEFLLSFPNYINNVLFLNGLEKSFTSYIKPGYGGEGSYYKEDTIPPVLGRLNLDRETFKQDFPHLALVLILPPFGIKYFIRRAPDFFDWRSGFFSFSSLSFSDLVHRIEGIENYNKIFTTKLIHKDLIEESSYFYKLGFYEKSIEKCDKFIEKYKHFIKSPISKLHEIFFGLALAWFGRGKALFSLGHHEEAVNNYYLAINNYDRAIHIQPDLYEAWFGKGIIFSLLGNQEEALFNLNKAIAIKPTLLETYREQGKAFYLLGQYTESITNYDKYLKVNSNDSQVWFERGLALVALKRYDEAILSYDKALDISPNFYLARQHKLELLLPVTS